MKDNSDLRDKRCEALKKWREDPEKVAAAQQKRRETLARRKSMKEWAWVIGNMPSQITLPWGTEIAGDLAGNTVMQQFVKAIQEGDTQAANFLMKLRGEEVLKVENNESEEALDLLKEQFNKLYCVGGCDEE